MKALVGIMAACFLVAGLLVAGPLAGKAQAVQTDLAASSGIALQAQATATDLVVPSGSELQTQAVEKYPIWVGGKQITSKNAKNVLGTKKKTVTYNAKTNTLTLNGAKITKAHVVKSSSGHTYRYGIYSRQDKGLTVVLKGTNKISVPGKATVSSFGIGVADDSGNQANLTVKGTGSLHSKAGKAGLFSFGILSQNLNIMGSAKVTASGGSMASTSAKPADSVSSGVGCYGVYATGFLALSGSAKLTASGKTKALNTSATYSQSYTPQVKAGASSKKLSVNKKNPATSVYTKYKYVSISKAAKSTAGKKPAKMTITKITPMACALSVTFKTISKNCTGYQLKLTRASDGKSWTYATTDTARNSATLSNLDGGAKYTVRIRAMNKVGSKTYYGAWSTAKSVRTESVNG